MSRLVVMPEGAWRTEAYISTSAPTTDFAIGASSKSCASKKKLRLLMSAYSQEQILRWPLTSCPKLPNVCHRTDVHMLPCEAAKDAHRLCT